MSPIMPQDLGELVWVLFYSKEWHRREPAPIALSQELVVLLNPVRVELVSGFHGQLPKFTRGNS